MAINKSELYSAIWASCDELRGRMDTLEREVKTKMYRINEMLIGRVNELAYCYKTPKPAFRIEVRKLEAKVNAHMEKMDFVL